jgi:hypothetical protein
MTPSLLNCKETTKPNIPTDLAYKLYPKDTISHSLEIFYIHEIHHCYNREYLALSGMLKDWLARNASFFKIPISETLKTFADARRNFKDNVICLGMVSDNIVPTMKLSPTEFEVSFELMAKRKGLNLKLMDKVKQ